MAKKKATIPTNESKADRFKRLAAQRVNKALKMIANIGKLGGVSYESTTAQHEKIIVTLSDAVNIAMNEIGGGAKSKEAFKL